MGKATSRPIIDYYTAVRRLGTLEVAKIEEGFERLGVRGQLRRSEFRTGFLNSVVGAPVPEDLAEALFNGFDLGATGRVTVHEFMCGLAVLRHGTPEEKLKLLFSVYDADRDQRLSDRDLQRFAQALGGSRVATRERAVQDALQALSADGGSVNFKRFSEWAREHIDSPLVTWLYDIEQRLAEELIEPGLRSNSLLAPPAAQRWTPRTSPNSMGTVTSLVSGSSSGAVEREEGAELLAAARDEWLEDEELVAELKAAWRAIVAESQFGVLDAATCEKALPSVPVQLRGRLFRALDLGAGTISLHQWLQGLGTCLAGSAEAQRALCFRLFAGPGGAAGGLVVPPSAAEELQRLAAAAGSAFAELSSGVYSSASTAPEDVPRFEPPPRCRDDRTLSRDEFMAEPWGSQAEAVIRALGRLVRVDLRSPPRHPAEEREIVLCLNAPFDPERPGQKGDVWYLISSRWWEKWSDSTSPEPKSRGLPSIDNSALVDHRSLRIGLCEHTEYRVITAAAWRALYAWYGGPGPPLPRRVIELEGHRELEMYPLRLHVSRTDCDGNCLLLDRTLEVSRAELLREVREKACAVHGIKVPVSILHRSTPHSEWVEGDESQTLHALGLIDGHYILLRLQGTKASVMRAASTSWAHGIVGLQNLGNTCYMNASLQCLIHTPLLPEYFAKEYLYDLNRESTWGTGGKLAVAFSELLADVSRARERGWGVIAPRGFVRMFTELLHEFAGWAQQDAQEFLSVFLTGLSDDVNRSKDKPYSALKDAAGRQDHDIAQEAWALHCRRECSAVSALFSGQLKSALRCTSCGHESSTFDPFMSLQVPLPEQSFRWVTCTVLSSPRAGLVQHTVRLCARVPKRGRVADLVNSAAELVKLNPADLIVAEVADGYVFRILKTSVVLSTLREDSRPTIFHVPAPGQDLQPLPQQQQVPPPQDAQSAAELELRRSRTEPLEGPTANVRKSEDADRAIRAIRSSLPGADDSTVVVHFLHRRLQKVREYFLNPYKPEVFGMPILARLPVKCSVQELYATSWRLVRHLVPDVSPEEGVWPFSLSTVKQDGSACASCSWRRGCLGCSVAPTQAAPGTTIDFSITRTFSLDWDGEVLQQHYKEKIAAHVHVDDSVELAQKERKRPEEFCACLDELTKEEVLEARPCSQCSKRAGMHRATQHKKQLGLWGCPPLLLVQLNRFHCRRGASWKLQNFIRFPASLDLRDYLAAGSPTTEDVKSTFKEGGHESEDCTDAQAGFSVGQVVTASERLAEVLGTGRATVTALRCGLREDRVEVAVASGARHLCKPEQLTPAPEAKELCPHTEPCFRTLTRAHAMYELYAVVNHIGGMGSGHYTAYVKKAGRWTCCNDDRVHAISEEDVVSANAYLLFYARKDVAEAKVTLADLFPPHTPGGSTADPEDVKRTRLRPYRWSPQPRTPPGGHSGSISDATSDMDSASEAGSAVSATAGATVSASSTGTAVATHVQRLECSNGHLILKRKRHLRWHQHWLRPIYCNLCQEHIRRDCVRWRCRFHCDFDVCTECYTRCRREKRVPGAVRQRSKESAAKGLCERRSPTRPGLG